jgi:hypothetical protein
MLALVCSAAWALLPAWPALSRGDLIGSPWTDLYPAAWGLDWFVRHQPGLPRFAPELAAPEGMPFAYSSPLHGWAAWPLRAIGLGPVGAWNATVVLARFATVACAFGAARAWGLGRAGAFGAALAWGASPFFHGYAAEGIVEGLDGWALALGAWALAPDALRARPWRAGALGAGALGLTLASSWYLGMVGCALLTAGALRAAWGWASGRCLSRAPGVPGHPSAAAPDAGRLLGACSLALVGGLLLALPFLLTFLTGMPGAAPLAPEVRAAMGAPLGWRPPGWIAPQPFALNAWVGLTLPLLAAASARRHPFVAAVALACAVLSLGQGPWYELPVLRSVRFPYRWHAGTLLLLACLAGRSLDALARLRPRLALALAGWTWAEGFLLSPIAPWLPAAPAVPLDAVAAPEGAIVLEIPGPLALPPGEINLSRPRSRYVLWGQALHGTRSAWAPDFNGVAASEGASWRDSWRSWDPLARQAPSPPDVMGARAAGVSRVHVHGDELGEQRARLLEAALAEGGAVPLHARGSVRTWALTGP